MGERYNDSEGKTVFVGKLDFKATEDDLRDMFEKYGKIDRVNIPNDRESGRPRGFAFVAFTDTRDAEEAIRACDGKCINDREITCNISKPRERDSGGRSSYNDRSSGDRYGGGGGGGRSSYNDRSGGGDRHGGGGRSDRDGGGSGGGRSSYGSSDRHGGGDRHGGSDRYGSGGGGRQSSY